MRWLDRTALALLSLATPQGDRPAMIGDLLEMAAAGEPHLARQALTSVPAMLALRVRRGGGVRVCAFACGAALVAGSAVMLAFGSLWAFVLFQVPLRAIGALPFTWWCVGLVPALLAGFVAGQLSWRLAVRLIGGRS